MNSSTNNERFLGVLDGRYSEKFFTDIDPRFGKKLNTDGIVVLPNFISAAALATLQKEANRLKKLEYRKESVYNLYVAPEDQNDEKKSPRNRKFYTTKGVVTDDQLPKDSLLRTIYEAEMFRSFICKLQGLSEIFPYADRLSSININYYEPGDNLEWHFDNADFAITLLIKQCDKGGTYEYFPNMRYTATGEEDYEAIRKILDGETQPKTATMNEGSLMIFRGNRSLHRVTKVKEGDRILVTLNYNAKPGIPLSEKSRLTFFGRVS